MDLALNNLQGLICHKTQQTKPNLWDFDMHTDYLISAKRPDLIIINKKRELAKLWTIAVPADHRIKLKESEKKDKYLVLARELKKLWNMKVTIIPIVVGALGTVTKRDWRIWK